jgi:hypothetical protein
VIPVADMLTRGLEQLDATNRKELP